MFLYGHVLLQMAMLTVEPMVRCLGGSVALALKPTQPQYGRHLWALEGNKVRDTVFGFEGMLLS